MTELGNLFSLKSHEYCQWQMSLSSLLVLSRSAILSQMPLCLLMAYDDLSTSPSGERGPVRKRSKYTKKFPGFSMPIRGLK